MVCSDCGASRPSWLGSGHVCHAKDNRRVMIGGKCVEIVKPHTAQEFELGFIATGDVYNPYRGEV